MAEVGISIAAKAAEYTVDPVATQLGYIKDYKSNFDNLEKQIQKLQSRRDVVQHSVDEARRRGEEIELHVVNWMDSAQKMIDEATEIITGNSQANVQCFKSWCPNLKKRYLHSRKAAMKANEVSELEKEGKFNKVSYSTPPNEIWHSSTKPFEDFQSRRSTVENILNELCNSNVNMVGVYGMGGIGKTTLSKEVGKRAEEQRLVDVVVFVEVSQKADIREIQGIIADKLGLNFREESEPGRARELRKRLKKERKILLILDNIWKGLDLETIGIPLGNEHPECRLLLTARDIHVLSNEMNSLKNFSIGNLDEEEAWNLFKKIAGTCVEQHNLRTLASDVAKRCGGLPIAIITIAKALKDKQEHAWRNALGELKRPSSESLVGSVMAEAYSCIRLSYNHLETEELKLTFLLCSTIAFTSYCSIEKILRYGVGLNLFRTICTMEEARDRVNTLVEKLKDSSLLLDTFDGEWFSMHDVVRDVGRAIAFKYHNQFIVIDDIIPREWKDKNTLEVCTSISLLGIVELPNKELDCPLLKFLYINGEKMCSKIRDNFFIRMPNVRVLHLTNMKLSPLPSSLRCLVNLRTLCLDCFCLRDIGFIVDMKDLEILVLSCTIKQLPTEIGQLTQLRVLDLSGCYNLEVIPPSSISRLAQLEELYMNYEFNKWHVEGHDTKRINASLDELEHLSQLTALQICIPDANAVPKSLDFQKLRRYRICIGVKRSSYFVEWDKTSRLLALSYNDANISVENGVMKKLKEIEWLCLIGKQGVKNSLYEFNRDGFQQLKHLVMEDNPHLLYIVDFSKATEPCVAFPHLHTFSLRRLINLEKICHGQLMGKDHFCRLKTIKIKDCVKLKYIFSSSIAKHLSQLKGIEVDYCKNMEEIFNVGRRNKVNVLDKLQFLSLKYLPKLRCFGYEEEVASTSDQERQIVGTPLPLFNEKVEFPNLETLELCAVNFENMWPNQLPLVSCFQNLTVLIISCCYNLKYLFSSSTLKSFMQLQRLVLNDCPVLEEIIRIDELENNYELSSLKILSIVECLEMKASIFNDKVTFPSLEKIKIEYMDNLEMIWHNQLEDSLNAQCYQKLHEVKVKGCQSLKNLFPLSIAKNLLQLKDLDVKKCGIEEVVAKEEGADEAAAKTFVFPQLTSLRLENLQELRCFYPGIHTMECPVLKDLCVSGCKKMDPLFVSELFNFQENLPDGRQTLAQKKNRIHRSERMLRLPTIDCTGLQDH